MIPETGSPKEFKHTVLEDVELGWCLACGHYSVLDPARAELHFCCGCTLDKTISTVRLGERTVYNINVTNVPVAQVKVLLNNWKKALRR
jgi:hypothetical protein